MSEGINVSNVLVPKMEYARKYYESVLDQRDDDKAAMFGLGSSAYYQNDIDAISQHYNLRHPSHLLFVRYCFLQNGS